MSVIFNGCQSLSRCQDVSHLDILSLTSFKMSVILTSFKMSVTSSHFQWMSVTFKSVTFNPTCWRSPSIQQAFCPFLVQFERFSREVDAVTVSAQTEQSTIHHFFGLCMPLTEFHRLQAPGRIKVLLCPRANIVTLTSIVTL